MSYDTPQDPMTVSAHGTTPTPAPTPFTIRWTERGYVVSKPDIAEAEVVLASEYHAALSAKDAEIARLITITKEQDLTARLLVEENQRLTATNVQREARDRK